MLFIVQIYSQNKHDDAYKRLSGTFCRRKPAASIPFPLPSAPREKGEEQTELLVTFHPF